MCSAISPKSPCLPSLRCHPVTPFLPLRQNDSAAPVRKKKNRRIFMRVCALCKKPVSRTALELLCACGRQDHAVCCECYPRCEPAPVDASPTKVKAYGDRLFGNGSNDMCHLWRRLPPPHKAGDFAPLSAWTTIATRERFLERVAAEERFQRWRRMCALAGLAGGCFLCCLLYCLNY
jgi:hypothetical protein